MNERAFSMILDSIHFFIFEVNSGLNNMNLVIGSMLSIFEGDAIEGQSVYSFSFY